MKEILKFLKQNQGHPVFIEDLQQAFPSIDLQQELMSLINKGLVYPYDEGYYLTNYGDDVIQGKRVNPYEKLRKTQQGISLQNRKDQKAWDAWVNSFIGFLNHFSKNHPELSLLMRNVALVTKKDIGNYHDIDQFTEDVQAVFNKFDFSLPDLRYKSENSYTVPEFLTSVEHAIAESVTRLHKYSPRHSNLFSSSKEYREVYDKVYNFLSNPDLNKFFEKLNIHKNGTFIKKDAFYTAITKKIQNLYNIKNAHLVTTSLDQLNTLISGFLRKLNNFVFYEGDPPEDIINRLKTFLRTRKDNVNIFEEFKSTCIPDLYISITQSIFQNEDYSGVNFSTLSLLNDVIPINNCNFQRCKFDNSHLGNSSIENCNFQETSFKNTNFSQVVSFRNNNLENADFKGSILSSEVDIDINHGNPINFVSLKLSQQEMLEKGFKDNESFDHTGMNLDKSTPGRGVEIKGESWIRFIQAAPTTPFPSKLYDLFNLHKVPLQRLLGWIGGKYDKNSQTLYITKVRSDLLQRSFELNPYFLNKIEEKGKGDFHNNVSLKELRNFTKYRKDLETYFQGWPKVFMNQAVREAKNKEAKFIAIPIDKSSPHRVYDALIHDDGVAVYPYEVKDGWYIIPVEGITKFASFSKLSWKIMSDVYYDFEELLRNNDIHFKTKDGVITIDHEGYIYLVSLTQLPDNVYFNNKGNVYLDSLTQLPDNVIFNNKGYVSLDSLTQLPDNVVFNNKSYVYLYSITQLPDNKEQIFKNDGIVCYNRDTKTYDPRTRKLSWVEEEDFEDEDPQVEPIPEENVLNKLHFNYKKDKEYLINQYLEDLFKAKKIKDFDKIKTIKERLDELISLGSKLSWKEPPFPPNKDIENKVFENLRRDVEETNRFGDAYDEQQYEGIIPLRLEEVISIKNKLNKFEIDYEGLEFIAFFAAKRKTFYGTVYDLIGVDDNGEYTILASGIASSYKEILEKTSSATISWKNPPIEVGSIWRNMEEDKLYYIKEIVGEYAVVYELYNEENGIYLEDILNEYNYHRELKKPLVIFNHYLLVGDINTLLNSGVKKLSWKIMSDVYYDFEELLRKYNIHFKTEDGVITIDHEGDVNLPSLTQLPDNVYFNNNGFVHLHSLKQLPDNVYFNNKGFVYLYSLKQLPDNVQFNNKGIVNLDSLQQLPENTVFNNKGDVSLRSLIQLPLNKEQIFKNDGIVIYNRGNQKYDPRKKSNL